MKLWEQATWGAMTLTIAWWSTYGTVRKMPLQPGDSRDKIWVCIALAFGLAWVVIPLLDCVFDSNPTLLFDLATVTSGVLVIDWGIQGWRFMTRRE